MSKNLALSFIGPHKGKQTATHGDTIKIEFTHPPQEVDDVFIIIRDLTHRNKGKAHFAWTDVVMIRGQIRNGKFQYRKHTATSQVDKSHPKLHEMQVTFVAPGGTPSIQTRLPDFAPKDHMVLAHRLKWFCEGVQGGKRVKMTGKAVMRVVYKAAMIVPTGSAPKVTPPAVKDPSLPLIARWAKVWQAHDPKLRKVVPVKTVALPNRAIKDADYAPLLAAMKKAATFAEHGIIALAIGHGDQGATNPHGATNAWCDLSAEDGVKLDKNRQIAAVYHKLYVDEYELDEMPGKKVGPAMRLPGGSTVVKRTALDKMRAIFKQHNIRLILLHTCTAGANKKFTQAISDRLQVSLRAHVLHIAYQGFAHGGRVDALYEKETATKTTPHEWPTKHLAPEVTPGAVPASPKGP